MGDRSTDRAARGGRRIATAGLLIAVAATLPSAGAPEALDAAESSLPSAVVGPRPGPAPLHAPPASTPILENSGGWQVPPTMVSGTERYEAGEYVYTDYLYDDHGAETGAVPGASPQPRPSRQDQMFAPPSGDVVYPTDEARYGYNAADLLELRLRTDEDAVVYRFTLNTMLAADATAIAVGIDTDGGDEETDWGHGIGSLGPLDLEHVLYTDGTSASLDGTEVAVRADVRRNQIEVTVPRDLLDPGSEGVWRHHAVTGIADGSGGFAPVEQQPSERRPGGAGTHPDPPPVLNVAFRFEVEDDEPMGLSDPEGRQGPYGTWREYAQAAALGDRDISRFGAEIDLGLVAGGTTVDRVPRTGFTNRLHVSGLELGEGIADERPWFLGPVQPYGAYVPTDYDPADPPGMLLVLHSLGGNHNQFQAASPNTYLDLAEQRDSVAITPLGRGPDGWYQREAEVDVFEVWADIARRFSLDPDRAASTGYSMGGYGTFRLTTLYPDLFDRGFPVVGPPGEGIAPVVDPTDPGEAFGPPPESDTTPQLDNLRNIPQLIWNGVADELVPVTGVALHAQRLDQLGYRYVQEIYSADHFLLALIDDWSRGADFLGEAVVDRDPTHVTYRARPMTHVPEYGLVHDKAYWVWDIEVADGAEHGLVDARSLAAGEGEPQVAPIAGAGSEPLPHVRRGQEWEAIPSIEPRNRLEVGLDDVTAATFALERAGLAPAEEPTVAVATDSATTLTAVAAFPEGTYVVDAAGEVVPSERDGDAIAVPLEAGEHELTFVQASPEPGADGDRRPLPATGGGAAAAAIGLLIAMAGLGGGRTSLVARTRRGDRR